MLWKIKTNLEPIRALEWIKLNKKTKSRIDLTGRIWSRKAEEFYSKIGPEILSETRVSILKKKLKAWINKNVPIAESI